MWVWWLVLSHLWGWSTTQPTVFFPFMFCLLLSPNLDTPPTVSLQIYMRGVGGVEKSDLRELGSDFTIFLSFVFQICRMGTATFSSCVHCDNTEDCGAEGKPLTSISKHPWIHFAGGQCCDSLRLSHKYCMRWHQRMSLTRWESLPLIPGAD